MDSYADGLAIQKPFNPLLECLTIISKQYSQPLAQHGLTSGLFLDEILKLLSEQNIRAAHVGTIYFKK